MIARAYDGIDALLLLHPRERRNGKGRHHLSVSGGEDYGKQDTAHAYADRGQRMEAGAAGPLKHVEHHLHACNTSGSHADMHADTHADTHAAERHARMRARTLSSTDGRTRACCYPHARHYPPPCSGVGGFGGLGLSGVGGFGGLGLTFFSSLTGSASRSSRPGRGGGGGGVGLRRR